MLRRAVLRGFKSIKAMDLELRPLNVLTVIRTKRTTLPACGEVFDILEGEA